MLPMMRPVFTAVVVLLLASLSACSGRDGGTVLRLGHDQPDGHPYDLAVERFAAGVREATGGELAITVFPAAQLGDSPEQIEGLHLGTLDMALVAFSHASQFCSELGLFGVPFLFQSEQHFAAVFDGEVGAALNATCRERYDTRLLSTFTSGYRMLFNGLRPLEQADDLTGLKIRVMGGEADALTWQVFGAIPVPMPYSEVYSALQAGVIDGAENEPASILSNKFYEAARYVAPTRHLVLPMGLFISETSFDRLTESQRAAILREARAAAVWQRDFMRRRNAEALAEMQASFGVELTGLDAAELRTRGLRIQDQVAAELGLTGLLGRVRAAAR
jgi:tripartite ATP-independent transporter DctP family solute receptor